MDITNKIEKLIAELNQELFDATCIIQIEVIEDELKYWKGYL